MNSGQGDWRPEHDSRQDIFENIRKEHLAKTTLMLQEKKSTGSCRPVTTVPGRCNHPAAAT